MSKKQKLELTWIGKGDEPTPPSQIEEESQTQRSLREMYELGKEHGRSLALKDMEIEKLVKEIKGE